MTYLRKHPLWSTWLISFIIWGMIVGGIILSIEMTPSNSDSDLRGLIPYVFAMPGSGIVMPVSQWVWEMWPSAPGTIFFLFFFALAIALDALLVTAIVALVMKAKRRKAARNSVAPLR